MSIHIRWSEALASYTNNREREQTVDWSAEETPASIVRAAGLTDADRSAVLAFVNGKLASMDEALADGDELAFDITIHGR